MREDKNDFNVTEATIADVHSAIVRGELTCRALVEMYLKRINTYDKSGPHLNSVIRVNPMALQDADKLDKKFKHSGLVGPLHGIPVLVKDNIETKALQTTAGSFALAEYVPNDNAFIIQKIIDAGAIILAKVNLHEFAIWGETISSILGQTFNPYDLTRTPGGSSGGTGASVAANLGMTGLGTDSINSIRSPASACNLVGIRPTLGLVSRSGIVPYTHTQDTAGPICRTVTDAVKMLDAIAGYDPADPATAWCAKQRPGTYSACLNKDGLRGKRIGVLRSFFGNGLEHQEVNTVMDRAMAVMENLGAVLIDIDEQFDANYLVTQVSVHLHELREHLDAFLESLSPSVRVSSLAEIIATGRYHPGIEENIKKAQGLGTDSVEYKERLIKRMKLQTQVMKLMADDNLDAVIYPHQKRMVVPVGEIQVERNGVLGSVTGFPSIVVPAGFSSPRETAPLGIPIGLEILGRPWSEPVLIEISYAFEQATMFRRQPLCTSVYD